MGHLIMENGNGLIIDARLTEANGTAERTTALAMIDDNARPGSTHGRRQELDTAEFVAGCRERGCTPHVSQNNTNRRSMPARPAIRLSHQHDQAHRRTCARPDITDAVSWNGFLCPRDRNGMSLSGV
jgi:hypothetical protein